MSEFIINAVKGMLMGAANVIPGVSGGTIALLTGIFEKLIQSLRSFDLTALKLLLTGKIKALLNHINFWFLSAVGAGIFIGILVFARVLSYLFENYELYVWSFFFGLILASVFFVMNKVRRISAGVIIFFAAGTAAAASIAFLPPAEENASVFYLFLCGIIAICSMILPGLSGSYVLLLMGNYQLIMIDAVVNLRLEILIPVAAGAAIGLLAFSHFLGWILKKFHDATISLLTGFIFGSLCILWPWKSEITQVFKTAGNVKEKVIGYDYFLPPAEMETAIAIAMMIAGVITLSLLETFSAQKEKG
ncbi:MAG: DUF368 domain-containing protein [Kiritimatiellales bacterium]